MRNFLRVWVMFGVVAAWNPADAAADPPLLLRFPTVSRTQIAFTYADNLWIVSRAGGEARQLTAGVGTAGGGYFSPDGSLIAFTGTADGARNIYVVSAEGGVPRRVTGRPDDATVRGWTPDGKRIIFSAAGSSFGWAANQLYTVAAEGGFPTQLPLPRGEAASLSPNGDRVAYVPHLQWQAAWKRYRGGQTTPIWIADLKTSAVTPLPRENSNDNYPCGWVSAFIFSPTAMAR